MINPRLGLSMAIAALMAAAGGGRHDSPARTRKPATKPTSNRQALLQEKAARRRARLNGTSKDQPHG